MQVRTRHTPTFGVARLLLAPGETAQAEPGSMLATSYGVGIGTRQNGSGLRSLAKAARGPALYTAPADGGWVDVAPPLPGDLYMLELDGQTGWCFGASAWLAASGAVQLDPAWPGFHALFGGGTGFLRHATGQGTAVLACYGALDMISLAGGEIVTVDPGSVIAYQDSLQNRLRAISPNGNQSLRTGEGLLLDFAGPGQLLTQTRSQRNLVSWLSANGLGARS